MIKVISESVSRFVLLTRNVNKIPSQLSHLSSITNNTAFISVKQLSNCKKKFVFEKNANEKSAMIFRALTASPLSVVPWTCKKQLVSCLHLASESFPGEK